MKSSHGCRQLPNPPQSHRIEGCKPLLPATNTTSNTQPMDQGINQNLKFYYRKQVILRQVKAIEKKTDLQITVLDALRMLHNAWDKFTETTIQNCFKHAKFATTLTNTVIIEDDKSRRRHPISCPSPLSSLWRFTRWNSIFKTRVLKGSLQRD